MLARYGRLHGLRALGNGWLSSWIPRQQGNTQPSLHPYPARFSPSNSLLLASAPHPRFIIDKEGTAVMLFYLTYHIVRSVALCLFCVVGVS